MRKYLPSELEVGRIRQGHFGSQPSHHANGAFVIDGPFGVRLKIVASNADLPESQGWEHVSVSTPKRCPNWPEMCFVKTLFWDEEETVVQYHPPKSQYVNNHAYVLHMFRHIAQPFPMPPAIMVGLVGVGELSKDECRAIIEARDGVTL